METAEPVALVDGRVLTGRRWVEAVLVAGGAVVAAGETAEVRRAAPTGTRTVPLGGRLVLPGLIDAHYHWLGSTIAREGPDVRRCRSAAELAEVLRRIEPGQPADPLIGGGWDETGWPDREAFTRTLLDRVLPDRPVVLYRVCHHVAVTNSPGLVALGVSARTPDPPGGRIGRDDQGAPNGWLYDNALRRIAELERVRFVSETEGAFHVLAQLRARGLTTLGAMSATPEEYAAGREAARSGRLPVGLRLYVTPATLDGFDGRVPPGDDRCLVAGVKVLLDGSLGARTAELSEAYADRPGELGLAALSDGRLAQEAERVRTLGLALAVHAIGDRAVTRAVDLAASERPIPPIRIEHASVVRPADVAKLASVRPPVVVQPDFVTSDTWMVERLGETRAAWTYPFRALFDRGVPLAGSSDAPIESADPWSGLATLVGRCGFTPDEAIQLYTAGGARALRDPRRGHLEAGAVGDLVVLDAPDPFRAIAAGGPVRAVFVGGVEAVPEGAI